MPEQVRNHTDILEMLHDAGVYAVQKSVTLSSLMTSPWEPEFIVCASDGETWRISSRDAQDSIRAMSNQVAAEILRTAMQTEKGRAALVASAIQGAKLRQAAPTVWDMISADDDLDD